MNRTYKSGAAKRKETKQKDDEVSKLPKLTSFLIPSQVNTTMAPSANIEENEIVTDDTMADITVNSTEEVEEYFSLTHNLLNTNDPFY